MRSLPFLFIKRNLASREWSSLIPFTSEKTRDKSLATENALKTFTQRHSLYIHASPNQRSLKILTSWLFHPMFNFLQFWHGRWSIDEYDIHTVPLPHIFYFTRTSSQRAARGRSKFCLHARTRVYTIVLLKQIRIHLRRRRAEQINITNRVITHPKTKVKKRIILCESGVIVRSVWLTALCIKPNNLLIEVGDPESLERSISWVQYIMLYDSDSAHNFEPFRRKWLR